MRELILLLALAAPCPPPRPAAPVAPPPDLWRFPGADAARESAEWQRGRLRWLAEAIRAIRSAPPLLSGYQYQMLRQLDAAHPDEAPHQVRA